MKYLQVCRSASSPFVAENLFKRWLTLRNCSTVLDFPIVMITSLECICSRAWVAMLSVLQQRKKVTESMVINKFWWQIDSFHMVAEWQCAWKQSRSRVLQHQHARQVIFTRVLYKNYTYELVYTQMRSF